MLGRLCLLLALAAGSMVGCSSTLEDLSAPVDVPGSFSSTGEAEVPDRWWTVFDDSGLNVRVERALGANLDLRSGWERLKAARAVVSRESADHLPTLDLFADAQEARRDVTDGGRGTIDGDGFEIGFVAEYEIDLWGRIWAGVEAREQEAEATRAEYRTAALTLSAELTLTWYRLMEAHEQLRLVEDQIETNEDILGLLMTRFQNGQSRLTDILRQRQLLSATRELRHVAESRVRVLEHRLAVLQGRPPKELEPYSRRGLPELPPLPATGVPAELVRRRPDLRAAFHRLKAADRELAVAIRDQYPRVSLSVSGSTIADHGDELFKHWAYSIVGGLVAPLFDGGRRWAEVDRTRAVAHEELYAYGQEVLEAFREVEDALIQERKQRDRLESIRTQVRFAEQAYDRLQQEYFNGIADYIDVLTALTDEQRLRRSLLSEELALLEFRVALYRALAGGFETEREVEVDG